MSDILFGVYLGLEYTYVGKCPIVLGIIETVVDHEFIGNAHAAVIG